MYMGDWPRAFLRVWCVFLVLAGSVLVPASANPKYAAYVIHAETGDVLLDRYATQSRYPASLTKMMTLYLLFEAVEAGEIKMTDKMTVSKRASLQPASRLGLARGTKIDVDTAIQALIIGSANDVATVVAERLGGSESKFARMMTKKAQEMGMRRTTFRNASGLPDRRQTTTAKDMAILSQRISQDFPRFFPYFGKSSYKWKGRTYRSHNKVTTSYKGADGLKTGYTRASGYNLATTATRGDHRLIGIVLGGRSGRTRDKHMKDILDSAFRDIRRKPQLVAAVHRVRPVPGLRPDRVDAHDAALKTLIAQEAAPPAEATEATAPTIPIPTPKTLAQAEVLNLVSLQQAIADVAATEANLEVAPVGQGDADTSGTKDWVIQVGAYSEQPQAIARIRATQDTIQSIAAAAGREVNIADGGARAVYRARFTKLTQTEAEASCETIRALGDDCMALQISR